MCAVVSLVLVFLEIVQFNADAYCVIHITTLFPVYVQRDKYVKTTIAKIVQ